MAAYNKQFVVQYCYYEMISSYFRKYTVANDIVEAALFMHFKEAGQDFQYSCEDYAIYSIENELPALINNMDLGKLDATIKMSKETNVISIEADKVRFDVLCEYKGNTPKLTYMNIKIRNTQTKKSQGA